MVPLVFLPTLRALILVLAALTLTLGLPSFAKSVRPESQTSPEALLNRVFEDIGRQRFDAALGHIEALIRARPNFRLAHLIKAVRGWAQAWSKKDVDAYLAYYARDFKTPNGEPRGEWEKAAKCFRKLPDDDSPASFLLYLAMDYQRRPPRDWQGVIELKEK